MKKIFLTSAALLLAAAAQAGQLDKFMPPDHRIGPGTDGRLLIRGKAEKEKCPSLAKLDADTAALKADNKQLTARFNTLSSDFGHLADLLAIPSNLTATLNKIEVSMISVQNGARTAQGVPQLREKAKKLETSITPALADVRAARDRAKRIADKVEPARKLSRAASVNFGRAAKAAAALDQALLSKEPRVTTLAQYSILVNKPPLSDCLQRKVDEIAGDLDRLVLELDRVEAALLYTPELPEFAALKRLADALDPLTAIRHEAELLEQRLKDLAKPLDDIEDFLDSTLHVNLPYPDPTCLCMRDFSIPVSAKTVLRGAAAIEDAIEKVLSSALWEVAKKFGVDKLVNSLLNAAKSELNAIEARLHLDINLDVPGLKELEALEARVAGLAGALPADIPVPDFDMNKPDLGWPGVDPSLNLGKMPDLLGQFTAPHPVDWEWLKVYDRPPLYGCRE